MTPAWQVRAYQRQRLLEKLCRLAYERSDRESERDDGLTTEEFHLDLAATILRYIQYWNPTVGIPQLTHGERPRNTFLELEVFPRIQKFARTNSERGYLLAELLKKVIETATRSLYNTLSDEEHHNPTAVFHAPSAMAEIALPSEDEED